MSYEPRWTLHDWQEAARARLQPSVYDYYAGGGGQEQTLEENLSGFNDWRILYRVLQDVSQRNLTTRVLGQEITFPVLIAPTAMQQMAHPEGEAASARAAQSVGTIMVASTLSNLSLEQIAAASSGPKWFQLYVYRDRGVTRDLIRRAEEAGFAALVLTVDTPLLGRRWRDLKNQFQMPSGLSLGNLTGYEKQNLPGYAGSGLANYVAEQLDASLSWADLSWLCEITRLPVVVKGLVRGDDAVRSLECGARAVVVSNHGGRNLDSAPATIRALSGVVQAVGERAEVYLDGGVRWGPDIIKALALGARAVLVGRPVLWGLAVEGEVGVGRVLEGLRRDLDESLALMGCPCISQLRPEDLMRVAGESRRG